MRPFTNLILAVIASACLVACGNDPVPTTPTTPVVPTTPPPLPPTQQERTTIIGDYTVTVTADPVCTNLPAAIRSRTYSVHAALRPDTSFRLVLGEADLVPSQSVALATIRNKTVTLWVFSEEYNDKWLESRPIVERIPNGGGLALEGRADGLLGLQGQAINVVFDGLITYCPVGPVDDGFLPSFCRAPPVECKSTQHMVRLEPR